MAEDIVKAAEDDLGIVWEAPPPKVGQGLAAKIAALLRQRPGEWARVLTDVELDKIEALRNALSSGNFAGGDHQSGQFKGTRHRISTDPDRYDFHAVYVGHLTPEQRDLV